MIKFLKTGTGVFSFFSLLIVGTYDIINDIIFLQYTNGTTKIFFFLMYYKVPRMIV